tara:strand:+ start:56782 stop:57864 length:1083 start_codon:yes stop_codon:yes gene_type:complete
MSCGATVSIRLTDVNTGELLRSQNGRALEACVEADVSETICTLADLAPQMELDGMPAKTIRVEVAVWNADEVNVSDGCPAVSFDVFGRPKPDVNPQPAFAGATYFRAGEEADVTVPLTCSAPEKLDSNLCAANLPTQTRGQVIDMVTVQRLQEERAATVEVHVGEATPIPDAPDSGFELKLANLFELFLDLNGPTPVWQDAIPLPALDLVCSTTLERIPRATTSVTCEENTASGEEVLVSPLLLDTEVLDAILAAIGATTFPEEGILIGRVIDEFSQPMAGVVVTPSDGSSVLYLNEDLTTATPGTTSSSAFFVSTDVAFGAEWTASSFGGERHTGDPRGGLIRGNVSTLIIRMTLEVDE